MLLGAFALVATMLFLVVVAFTLSGPSEPLDINAGFIPAAPQRQHVLPLTWKPQDPACLARTSNGVQPCLRDLYDYLARLNTKRTLRVLQVGACDGNYRETPGDAFQEAIFTRGHAEAILFEPSPQNFRKLDLVARQAMNDAPELRVSTQNKAVCGVFATLPFHRLSPSFATDIGAPQWIAAQMGSFDRSYSTGQALNALKESAKFKAIVQAISEPDASKRAELIEKEADAMMEKYLEVDTIECIPPREALQLEGWAPGDLDVLMVDAEGKDAEIVESFLDLYEATPTPALPVLVVYEHTLLSFGGPEANKAKEHLEARLAALGYDCSFSVPSKWADTICFFK